VGKVYLCNSCISAMQS